MAKDFMRRTMESSPEFKEFVEKALNNASPIIVGDKEPTTAPYLWFNTGAEPATVNIDELTDDMSVQIVDKENEQHDYTIK